MFLAFYKLSVHVIYFEFVKEKKRNVNNTNGETIAYRSQ